MTVSAKAAVNKRLLKSIVMTSIAAAPYLMIAVIAGLFYAFVLPHFRPYAWADDWIYVKPLAFTSFAEWWTWLWQQHVDHRIPIQKFTNFFILRWAGFDYRWLVAINFAMAMATSAFLLEAANQYRGRRSIGDLAIPLIVLNFGMGYSQWGFHFQFTSSVMLMSGFLLSTLLWLKSQKSSHALFAVAALTLASLTGMNGALPALGASVVFVAWSIWHPKPLGNILLFSIPLATSAVILAKWSPAETVDYQSQINAGDFLNYTIGLTTGSFTYFLQNYETLSRVVIAALIICAVGSIVLRTALKKIDDTDVFVAAFFAIYMCLIVSISYGRAKLQGGWDAGSAIHYGVLTVFIPIISWIIVSKAAPRLADLTLGAAILIVGACVFNVNYVTRTWFINYYDPLQAKALLDLKSDKPIEQIAAENITQFHIGDQGIQDVVDGISAFRRAGAEIYGGK